LFKDLGIAAIPKNLRIIAKKAINLRQFKDLKASSPLANSQNS
jgi:hypothetical protein